MPPEIVLRIPGTWELPRQLIDRFPLSQRDVRSADLS